MRDTDQNRQTTDAGKQFDEYTALMSSMKVSVSKHLLDQHFTLIWANDFYYKIIKYPKDEYEALFHNHVDEYYQSMPDVLRIINDKVVEAISKGLPGYECICQMPQKGGTAAWVRLVGTFTDEVVDGYGVAYTVFTDITDLVEAQTEKSVAYNNLPGFVAKFMVGEDGFHFLGANDKFLEFFDKPEQNGLSYGLTNFYSEKNHSAQLDNFLRMRRGLPVHFTLQAKDREGGDVWLQVNGDCISRQNDAPVYLIIYIDITDVTEQKALQRQLEERSEMLRNALDAAEQANKAKSEFLSRMSHDIRTPMNAIIGMTSIAASHIDNRERVTDCLEKITVSSKLLLGLINEVLDMARIESGKVSLTDEEFCLGDMIQDIITIMQPSVDAKGHSFDIYVFELEHEEVVGDPQHLQQVFLNILSNAVKYTPDHGHILFELREKPSKVREYGRYEFIFQDDGYGMKPEFLEKIFTPFERAQDPDVRVIQGTGLGMAISRNIVRMMDGDIQVESVWGKGSKFIVTLSLRLQNPPGVEWKMPEKLPVLVVDDDQLSCETVCDRLREVGLEGQWVLSGREAVKRAVKAHQDGTDFLAVIIDLKMPGMDGIETTKCIREEVGLDIPIILLSAYDWAEYEDKAIAAGVNGCIVKPLLKSGLICALRKYVLKEEIEPSGIMKVKMEGICQGKRFLLVEDNALNREIAAELFSQAGAVTDTAENGQKALDLFCASPAGYYDMIFMDVQMPVMDGYEATRALRKLDRPDAASVPIIAMTANAFEEDAREAKEAGMDDHLPKPIDIGLLNRIMAKYMGDPAKTEVPGRKGKGKEN